MSLLQTGDFWGRVQVKTVIKYRVLIAILTAFLGLTPAVIDFVFNTSIILIVYCNQFISILCLLFVFCYIVDYYIHKALKESKTEHKREIPRGICKNK